MKFTIRNSQYTQFTFLMPRLLYIKLNFTWPQIALFYTRFQDLGEAGERTLDYCSWGEYPFPILSWALPGLP